MKIIYFTIILFAFTIPLYCQTLSLQDAIKTAKEKNLDLKILSLQLKQTENRIALTKSSYFPQINLIADQTEQNSFETQLVNTGSGITSNLVEVEREYHYAKASMTQKLIDLSFFPYLDSVRLTYESAIAEFKQKEQNLIFDITNAYYALLQSEELTSILKKNTLLLEKYLNESKEKLKLGYENKQKTISTQLALQDKRQTLYKYNKDYYSKRIALNRLIGLSASSEIKLTDIEKINPAKNQELKDFDFAWNRRFDAAALLNTKQSVLKEKTSLKKGFLPVFDFQGTYGYLNEDEFRMKKDDRYWIATIRGTLNIFEGFSRTLKIKNSNLKIKQISQEIEKLKQTVSAEIDEALFYIKISGKAYHTAISNKKISKENLENTEQKFKLKQITNETLISAKLTYNDALSQYVQAKVDLLLAEERYRYVLGNLT